MGAEPTGFLLSRGYDELNAMLEVNRLRPVRGVPIQELSCFERARRLSTSGPFLRTGGAMPQRFWFSHILLVRQLMCAVRTSPMGSRATSFSVWWKTNPHFSWTRRDRSLPS